MAPAESDGPDVHVLRAGLNRARHRGRGSEVRGPLNTFLALPALQLFAYEMADYLGKDVDQPRNLAKSVTVE